MWIYRNEPTHVRDKKNYTHNPFKTTNVNVLINTKVSILEKTLTM